MKKILLSLSIILISLISFAQAIDGAVAYKTTLQPAAVIELSFPPDVVTAAMNNFLSKKGKAKKSDHKGFTLYRNSQPMTSDSSNADLYFKVERKSRKQKEVSVISLLLTVPTESTTLDSNARHLNMEEAKTFLNDLAIEIEAYNLELMIKEQAESLSKAEAKSKNLVDDGIDLGKKREALDKKMEENKLAQQAQVNEISSQKQKLATLVSQRKA